MITDETDPGRIGPCAPRAGVVGLAGLLLVAGTGTAAAFPFLDVTNQDQVPQGTELAAPDAQDLQHQLQLANGFAPPAGGGWTFVPRVDWQEMLTDNVLETHSQRQADLGSFVTPGIAIAGDMPRIQATFDFAPTLSLYARTGDLNSLTEQMNGVATVTLVPDLAFVDVRTISGVHSLFGGVGGLGTLGAPTAGQTGLIPSLAGNSEGLTKEDEVQTASFAISPYLLQHFGDWGTGKLGYSLTATDSNTLNGFVAPPIPSGGGVNSQTLVSNEEIAHFATGDIMQFFQNSFDVDLLQSQTDTGAGVVTGETGVPAPTTQNTTSVRNTVSDTITYQATRSVSVSASGGHEDITFSGFGAQEIHDLTWSLGATWVPNPDSSLSVSYGHLNGFTSLTVNGHYALTPRTMLTVSYGSSLGTQLENVQNQLNLEATGANGAPVNAVTGAPLFGAINALGVEDGVFRTTTLTVGGTTSLDRDTFTVNLLMATQTSSGTTTASTASSKVASVNWKHQMNPDMTLSAALSYDIQDQSAGALSALNPGNNTSFVGSLAWQWQISSTLSGSVQYSYFERASPVASFAMYQNMLILGISKHF